MNTYNNSTGKIIDYNKLSKKIIQLKNGYNNFIDIGVGNGRLLFKLQNKYLKCFGVDKKDYSSFYKNTKIVFYCIDITIDTCFLRKFENNDVIVHMGFSLVNTFSRTIFEKTIKSVLDKIPNGALLFEMQNKDFFIKKYNENIKYTSFYKDVKIISWNKYIKNNNELCQKVTLEYYSEDNKLINKTVDFLYPHDHDWYKEDPFYNDYNINKFKWNTRNNQEMKNSHYYYLIKRSCNE